MPRTFFDNTSQPELGAMISSAFLNAPNAMCLFDLSQREIVLANEYARRHIGWIAGQHSETGETDPVARSNSTSFSERIGKYADEIRSGQFVEFPWNCCLADGNQVPFAISAHILSPDDDRIAICSFRNDADQLQTQQALRLTEFAVEVAPEAMFTVAPNGRILNANRTACNRLEYSRDELLQMRISDIDPHYSADFWPDHWQELRRGGRTFIETQHRTKSGRILDVEVSVSYFEFGGTEYCCSSIRDVTDRKAAEHQLRLAQFSLERSSDAVLWMDTDGTLHFANQSACQMLGYTNEELTSMTVADIDALTDPDDWPRRWQLLKQRGTDVMESIHLHKDGRRIPVEIRSNYLEFGEREYNFAFIQDITSRKQSLALMTMQRAVLESIASDMGLDKSLDLLCESVQNLIPNAMANVKLLDEQRQKLNIVAGPQLSTQHREIMDHKPPGIGYGPCAAAVTQAYPIIVDDVEHDPVFSKMADQVRKLDIQTAWSFPILSEGKPVGTFCVALSKKQLLTDFHRELMEGAAYLAAIAVQRKKQEQELERNRNELAHVSRLSTMGEMVAGLAHELNQPLTVIANLGYTIESLIRSDSKDKDPSISEYAGIIREQSVRAGEIIRRLRSFVKRAEGKRTAANLDDIVRDALTLMDSDLRDESVCLNVHYSESDHRPLVDAIQIQQVVVNLVRNSVDALKENPGNDRRLDVRIAEHGNERMAIVITDNGPGIPPDEIEEVFEAFYTTKSSGMGMGLAISRSIVQAHFGELTANKNIQRGAEFCVIIPINGMPYG